MSTPRRALLLVALFLVPLLPTASAGVPEPRAWAPYDAISEVNALALAQEGTTLAAALKASLNAPSATPAVPGTGATRFALTDLSIFATPDGHARNGTTASPTPLGRTHVAVSRAGDVVASLGNESRVGTSAQGVLTLYYSRVSPGASWSAGPSVDLAIRLDGRAVGLALSEDGSRVAVLTQDGGTYSLRGFGYSSGNLNSVFDHRAAGTGHALAASRDLSRLAFAGQIHDGDNRLPAVLLFPFSQADAEQTYVDRAANNTAYRSVAVSADGARLAVGTADGRVLHFGNVPSLGLVTPASVTLGADNVTALAMSADGARVAAASGAVLGHFDATAGLRLLWNTTLASAPANLALNRTGGLLAVAVSGSGGGAFAYSDKDGVPIWRFPGDTRAVALNAAGTEIAYAQRSFVSAARIGTGLAFEFPGGAKTGPALIAPANGTATYELIVRNPGASPERVVFEGPADVDVRVVAQPSTLLVNPGAIERVALNVTAGSGLTGSRSFNVTARSLTSGLVDNVTLALSIQARPDISLFVNESDVLAEPNVTTTLLLAIINNGTLDAAVGLRATQAVSQGQPWNLTVEQTSFNVLPGTRYPVRAFVTPPADVLNGTSNRVTFVLEGPNVSEVRHVTFRINPKLAVEVNATGLVKFVEPGKTAFYNVTVVNTGSLARQFEAYYEVVSTGGKDWPVEMSTTPFRLEAGARTTIPVRIIAPLDISEEDRTSIRVFARSVAEQENEAIVSGNVTLFANYQKPRPTTTTPTGNVIPFPTPILAIAAAAFVAVSLRPRGLRP